MIEREFIETGGEEWVNDPEYRLYELLYDATETICEAMDRQDISRSELAKRLHVSRASVSKFLNGPRNAKLETIIRYCDAVGLEVDLAFVPRERVVPVAPEDVIDWDEHHRVSEEIWASAEEILRAPTGGGVYINEPRPLAA